MSIINEYSIRRDESYRDHTYRRQAPLRSAGPGSGQKSKESPGLGGISSQAFGDEIGHALPGAVMPRIHRLVAAEHLLEV